MRKFLVLGILILAIFVVGCGKGPAEAALKAADEAIARAQPSVEKYVPEQFAALTASAADARAKFNEKKYAEATAAAKDIPTKASEAMTAAAARKDELTAKWNEMQVSMPDAVKTLTTKMDVLNSFRKLPKGFEQAQVDAAKTTLADVSSGFDAATAAATEGDLVAAVTKADEAKIKADELAKMLEPIQVAPPK